jgi:hypothetical protein
MMNQWTLWFYDFHNARAGFPVVFVAWKEIFSLRIWCILNLGKREDFVGITSGKKKVFLTSALSHSIYGDTSFKVLSRFIRGFKT